MIFGHFHDFPFKTTKLPKNQNTHKIKFLPSLKFFFFLIFYQSMLLIRVYRISLLIIITLTNNRKIDVRLSFFISTETAKLNTLDMCCNHQIAKLNTRKMFFFCSKCGIKYPQNLIPLRYKSSCFQNYSFYYDKDLLYNSIKIKKKNGFCHLLNFFSLKNELFSYRGKFSHKISPRSRHS